MKNVKAGTVGIVTSILVSVGAALPTEASAQTLTTLYSFGSAPGDGGAPCRFSKPMDPGRPTFSKPFPL